MSQVQRIRTVSVVGRSFAALCVAVALAAGAPAARAQTGPELPALSPGASVEQRVGVTDFGLEYSSPAVRKRRIWGALVPYDKPWRAGANAATKLTASRDFTFGGKPVKAGSYSLFVIPRKGAWTVALNSDPEIWGTAHDPGKDVVRVNVRPRRINPPRERLTYLFSNTTDDSTSLQLEWERIRVAVPIQVDTKAHVTASIEKSLATAWRPHMASARWLLESGGNLGQALKYVETSIAVKPTWSNHWVKAQILGKQGKKADATAAARQAISLGSGDRVFDGFFKKDVEKAIQSWK